MKDNATFVGYATVIKTSIGLRVPCDNNKVANKYEFVADEGTVKRFAEDIGAERVAFVSVGDTDDGVTIGFIVDENALNTDKPLNERASLALGQPIFGEALFIAMRMFGGGEYETVDLPKFIFDSLVGT